MSENVYIKHHKMLASGTIGGGAEKNKAKAGGPRTMDRTDGLQSLSLNNRYIEGKGTNTGWRMGAGWDDVRIME